MAANRGLTVLAGAAENRAMTRKTSPATELVWDHSIHDIPQRGLSAAREATPEELANIALTLDLVACNSIQAAYSIEPSVAGRYRLWGTLRAEVAQACVVTLDPVDSRIEESFDVMFWPEADMPAPTGGALDLDEETDPEPIAAGQIAVGRVVFECLAAALDPFPRKPDAVLEQRSVGGQSDAADKPESPFAVLANIKPRP